MTNAITSALPDPSSYASIGWVFVVLGMIMVTLKNGADFIKSHVRESPPSKETYVDQKVCSAEMRGQLDRIKKVESDVVDLRRDQQTIRDEIRKGFIDMNLQNERRAKEIHDRINPILERL